MKFNKILDSKIDQAIDDIANYDDYRKAIIVICNAYLEMKKCDTEVIDYTSKRSQYAHIESVKRLLRRVKKSSDTRKFINNHALQPSSIQLIVVRTRLTSLYEGKYGKSALYEKLKIATKKIESILSNDPLVKKDVNYTHASGALCSLTKSGL